MMSPNLFCWRSGVKRCLGRRLDLEVSGMAQLIAEQGDRRTAGAVRIEPPAGGSRGSPLLARIGATLHVGRRCAVYDGGFVRPAADPPVINLAGALEGVIGNGAHHGRQEARSARAAGEGRQGQARDASSSTTRRTAAALERQLIALDRLGLKESLTSLIAEALRAYPQFALRGVSAGVWLCGEVQPVADLPRRAAMATFVPHHSDAEIQSWAWWSDGVWIGPRHTYADGSICAFERGDTTWIRGKSLATLLDLQTLWICQQLFLRAYDWWPGRQMLHSPVERQLVQRPGELCGCGSDASYEACCHDADLAKVATECSFSLAMARSRIIHRGPRIPSTYR